MIRLALIAAALAGFVSAAHADQCQDDVAKIDKALSSQEVDADVRAQAEDMRSQAVQLCGAGNAEEGLAVTAEAKVLLKIE
ncbi:MAG: hypothetical protein LCH46_14580 [Proteobacteria bacterium]|nr:hypothetical protein [Pseudomonadota bacterium]